MPTMKRTTTTPIYPVSSCSQTLFTPGGKSRAERSFLRGAGCGLVGRVVGVLSPGGKGCTGGLRLYSEAKLREDVESCMLLRSRTGARYFHLDDDRLSCLLVVLPPSPLSLCVALVAGGSLRKSGYHHFDLTSSAEPLGSHRTSTAKGSSNAPSICHPYMARVHCQPWQEDLSFSSWCWRESAEVRPRTLHS